eukprot:3269733-Rhodomonas_salina.2
MAYASQYQTMHYSLVQSRIPHSSLGQYRTSAAKPMRVRHTTPESSSRTSSTRHRTLAYRSTGHRVASLYQY